MVRLSLFLGILGSLALAAECEIKQTVPATIKACIPGAEVRAISAEVSDPRRNYYEVYVTQPVDHSNPALGNFKQRLILAHRGYDEPLVLQTSGYAIFRVAPSNLTTLFDTNQIQVEHRFFKNSAPETLDWSKLDIRQSAADFHTVTERFKQIYKKAWVNTGASKGGMTSIYHRRFYPNDLDGTVANVAPMSFHSWDERYIDFVDNVGGEAYKACREKLANVQKRLLENRERLQAQISGNFEFLGGKDLAYEHGVQEMVYYFWQYNSPEDPKLGCHKIPTADSSDDDLLNFFQAINPLDDNYGSGLADFVPYYFQAASELGGPALKRSHLAGLLKYDFTWNMYTPKNVEYTYSNLSMLDVDKWVGEEGEKIMMVYGEFDPWSAGRFPSECKKDCHWYTAPKESHRATIGLLKTDEREEALQILEGWFQKKSSDTPTFGLQETSLEALEFEARKGRR